MKLKLNVTKKLELEKAELEEERKLAELEELGADLESDNSKQ